MEKISNDKTLRLLTYACMCTTLAIVLLNTGDTVCIISQVSRSLFCSVTIAPSLTIANVMASPSSSTTSPSDKCVNIRLDDSQRIYLTGSGQKGSIGPRGLPGKIGPKGEEGEQGLRGIVGPRGVKCSKGDDSGMTDLENRLAAAERLITELMAFRKNANCVYNTFSSCKAALDTGCSDDDVYYLKLPGVQTRFKVRQTDTCHAKTSILPFKQRRCFAGRLSFYPLDSCPVSPRPRRSRIVSSRWSETGVSPPTYVTNSCDQHTRACSCPRRILPLLVNAF